jgi:hypothetical protein
MLRDMELDDDVSQRRLQRLEHRYRRAQNALTGASAVYESLREVPGASELQLRQAAERFELAQQVVLDIQRAIELYEDQHDAA